MRIWSGYEDVRKSIRILKELDKYGIPDQLLRDYALNVIFTYRGVREFWFELLFKELPDLVERFMVIYNEELIKTGKESLKEELEKKWLIKKRRDNLRNLSFISPRVNSFELDILYHKKKLCISNDFCAKFLHLPLVFSFLSLFSLHSFFLEDFKC